MALHPLRRRREEVGEIRGFINAGRHRAIVAWSPRNGGERGIDAYRFRFGNTPIFVACPSAWACAPVSVNGIGVGR